MYSFLTVIEEVKLKASVYIHSNCNFYDRFLMYGNSTCNFITLTIILKSNKLMQLCFWRISAKAVKLIENCLLGNFLIKLRKWQDWLYSYYSDLCCKAWQGYKQWMSLWKICVLSKLSTQESIKLYQEMHFLLA